LKTKRDLRQRPREREIEKEQKRKRHTQQTGVREKTSGKRESKDSG